MTDFWQHSGYHLLERRGDGRLAVTDEYLRAYLARPEMQPAGDACAAERALHAALTAEPRGRSAPAEIAAIADPDARENYAVLLDFRDRLVAAGTVENAYLALFREGALRVPPLFIDQLVHVALRGILEDAGPLEARAGELLFRSQRVTIRDGTVMVADRETVEMLAATGGLGDLGRLVVEAGAAPRRVELDVLSETNADLYWGRDERHDTVLDLGFGRAGLAALARVLAAWIAHFTGAEVRIEPVATIRDERWVWHVGLDAEASAILNDLYAGVEGDETRQARLLALFRLEFVEPALMRADLAGRPVYLAMAMNEDGILRLKPQNLLVNLPLATAI